MAAAAGLVLVLALVPEFNRYTGERELYRATSLFEAFLHRPADENRDAAFRLAAESASTAGDSLPGDWRPPIQAGTLRLFVHQPQDAIAFYKRAFSLGERPEIDLDLGLAFEMAGNHPSASAAILRAAWVSPAIVSDLPENLKPPVEAAIAQDAELLRSGRLGAPPPLPVELLQ